ncbi:hypothetical protein TNCV_2341171 [Trichonephila clavipes]|nr:hypothetical protein TNCV_2341171 [Trichonephila clavipes]
MRTGIRILDHSFKHMFPSNKGYGADRSPFVGALSQQLEKEERVHHTEFEVLTGEHTQRKRNNIPGNAQIYHCRRMEQNFYRWDN